MGLQATGNTKRDSKVAVGFAVGGVNVVMCHVDEEAWKAGEQER